MRALFVLGCGLLLLETSCSGSTSRSSPAPAGAGSGGASSERPPETTMASSGGEPPSSSSSAGGSSADAGGQGGVLASAGGGGGGEADEPSDVDIDCGCASTTIAWWPTGGRRPTEHASFVDPCGSFQHIVSDTDMITLSSCKSELVGGCSASLGVYELNAALAHPDVQAALAVAPVFYGLDMRDSDGSVDHLEIDEKIIEIGAECDDPECAIPAGVAALGFLLGSITTHELGSGCNLEPP